MFETYTERAKRVLAYAKYEASQMGSDTMEPEHLLLGLIRESEDVILGLFAESGIDAMQLRLAVGKASKFPKRMSTPMEIAISRASQRVLAYAVEEWKRLAHEHVGSEHLLLGLLREESCMAAQILAGRGLEAGAVREAIVAFHRARAEARERDEAVELLVSVALALDLDTPVRLFTSSAELKVMVDAFEGLSAHPVEFSLLAHRSGLVVCSQGKLPVALVPWLRGVVADERRTRAQAGGSLFWSPAGRPVYLAWVKGRAFLLVVPTDGADPALLEEAARAAAARLAPIFDEREGGLPTEDSKPKVGG